MAFYMLKSQIIAEMATKLTYLSEKKIADGVGVILEMMSDTLSHNGRIEIRGFGSFTLHHRLPRRACNPKTGEEIMALAKYHAHFKPGKDLKARIDNARMRYPILED
tara:strand:- start:4010 stop:4330 length:321 start_codon:yes stop_codon:yes gene_type:complete